MSMTHIDRVGFDGLVSLQSFGADEITEIQIYLRLGCRNGSSE